MADFDYKRNSRVVNAQVANGGSLNQSMQKPPSPNEFDKVKSAMGKFTKKPLQPGDQGKHLVGKGY